MNLDTNTQRFLQDKCTHTDMHCTRAHAPTAGGLRSPLDSLLIHVVCSTVRNTITDLHQSLERRRCGQERASQRVVSAHLPAVQQLLGRRRAVGWREVLQASLHWTEQLLALHNSDPTWRGGGRGEVRGEATVRWLYILWRRFPHPAQSLPPERPPPSPPSPSSHLPPLPPSRRWVFACPLTPPPFPPGAWSQPPWLSCWGGGPQALPSSSAHAAAPPAPGRCGRAGSVSHAHLARYYAHHARCQDVCRCCYAALSRTWEQRPFSWSPSWSPSWTAWQSETRAASHKSTSHSPGCNAQPRPSTTQSQTQALLYHSLIPMYHTISFSGHTINLH